MLFYILAQNIEIEIETWFPLAAAIESRDSTSRCYAAQMVADIDCAQLHS